MITIGMHARVCNVCVYLYHINNNYILVHVVIAGVVIMHYKLCVYKT